MFPNVFKSHLSILHCICSSDLYIQFIYEIDVSLFKNKQESLLMSLASFKTKLFSKKKIFLFLFLLAISILIVLFISSKES